LNTLAQLDEEETEVANAPAKKTKSFPTVIVAGLGILILVLSAATGMICYRSRSKTTFENSNVEMQEQNQEEAQEGEENQQEAKDPVQSLEHLVG
jgi:flagellar basal body-associated protein FliL